MADDDVVRIKRPVEWRPIPGFEGRYSITRDGRVWSHSREKYHKTPHWMTGSMTKGYWAVNLDETNRKYIHHLVMMTWGEPRPSPAHEINHRDTNKLNNHISNLEWLTHVQNVQHATINGLMTRGNAHGMAKLTEIEVLDIRRRYAGGEKQMTLASEYNVHFSTIHLIVKRKKWRHI